MPIVGIQSAERPTMVRDQEIARRISDMNSSCLIEWVSSFALPRRPDDIPRNADNLARLKRTLLRPHSPIAIEYTA